MRSGHRPNPMALAAFLGALAGSSFMGAQRQVNLEEKRPMAFDPLALLRRPPRRERGNGATWWKPHCGAKEAAKFLRRGQAGNDLEWRKRMRWNAEVLPRVLEARRRNEERQCSPP